MASSCIATGDKVVTSQSKLDLQSQRYRNKTLIDGGDSSGDVHGRHISPVIVFKLMVI